MRNINFYLILKFAVAFSFAAVFSSQVNAHELFESHLNPRALGMGGAYNSVVDDEESLWFNPAGIAKNLGIHWDIADIKAGASDPTPMMSAYSDLQKQATFQQGLNALYGKPIWAGASGKTAVIIPFFAAAYYYDVDASIIADNPVNPTMTLNYVTDQGFALGTGFSIAQVFQMGFATRYINRSGVRGDFGSATIADILAGTTQPSTIFNNINNKGTGYALDFGSNITIPGPVKPTLSFVWKNMGNTNFHATGSTGIAPPTDQQDMQIGASLLVDAWIVHIVPSIEFRNLNDSTVQIGNKTHLGVELGIPFLDLRAGLYQGNFSYGFGLDMGLLELEAASWASEVGGYPGQLSSRRYLVELNLRLGFDFLGGGSSSSSGSKSGSGTATGGSGSSSSSTRRNKVRR